ncbi:MAG: RNA polymerase sigma factor RpoE [Candidatus Accumulibacter sp.]|nr:RNA polymerase sigma factor RpoE [Accumulibacter sp.]
MDKCKLEMASIEADDQRGFERLVKKYRPRLGRMLSRYIGERAEIEDISQETFFKAYLALPTFRGESAFYTWLYRIGVNTAKNYLIAQSRRAPASSEIDVEKAETFHDAAPLRDIATPEGMLHAKQVGVRVNEAMASLPIELRQAIVFREIDGLGYDEIAKKMSCPVGTVRSRIFRAREAVAEKLRPLTGHLPGRRC